MCSGATIASSSNRNATDHKNLAFSRCLSFYSILFCTEFPAFVSIYILYTIVLYTRTSIDKPGVNRLTPWTN